LGKLKVSMATRFFCFLLLSASVLAQAQGTKLWNQSSYESFEKGTPRGVAIRSDGTLEASPAADEVLTTAASSIWSIAADFRGNVYLGTGSPATVLKVAPDGKSTPLLETGDLSVPVVRFGPDGMLYAATLPNGKVYRIDPNGPDTKLTKSAQPLYDQKPAAKDGRSGTDHSTGNAAVVFDPAKLNPKPTYIWDLAFDRQGRLYVATGGPAAIYRVNLKNPGAQPENFFSSSEQHIRCMVFANDGTLYAGSDGRGLVYRISPDGKGFVLFEAPDKEIPALALDPQGNLYVAALGTKGPSTLPPLNVHSAPTLTATIRIVTAGAAESASDSTLVPDGTTIYQLAPDGAPRELWTSKHDVVYALAWQQDAPGGQSGLLVGSGNLGYLYRIASDGTYADLAHLEAHQTTALAFAGNTLYAATSNIGKLYKLAVNAKDAGAATYISQVHDSQYFSQWGQAQVRGTGGFDLYARVGNIEQPTEGWSDWQRVTAGAASTTLPQGRFLQWKAVLRPDAQLHAIGFYYLPQNVAPVVDEIVVKLHARVVAGLNAAAQFTPVPINFPASATDGVTYLTEQSSTPLMAMPDVQWATARWKAHDGNGDKLSYSIFYRGDGEANWQLLRSNIHHSYASFDLTRIPDGGYTLRIVASDDPSHPLGDALTGFKDSKHFLLDTASPQLSPLQATVQNGSIHLTFDAQTKQSTIARAYYSVDAGAWQYIEPVGRLSDSLHERYDVTVPIPARSADVKAAPSATPLSSQHVIAVRVVDRAGNAATAKAVVQ
jgi:hypothetical protein